jgi:predicted Zn-dependent protease
MSQGILTEAALITLGETALRQNPNRGEILAAIGLGAQVGIMLPYSRSHESEADYMGLLYTAQAGYDPREAPKFWARMAKSGAEPPEFLSTHPASGRRQRDLNQEMPKALELYQKAPVKYGEGERF